ncbi:hypothetical protein ABLB84_07090 [Xenorhabdus szentirmaii]|uniref:hypothetical protein n=1 Tax=Xenorhabdus szentirmaii TaxID=290112 RepID=UPI0032B87F50
MVNIVTYLLASVLITPLRFLTIPEKTVSRALESVCCWLPLFMSAATFHCHHYILRFAIHRIDHRSHMGKAFGFWQGIDFIRA